MSGRCDCKTWCGDDGDVDGPGLCKGLPVKREPLVEIVLVPRSALGWRLVPRSPSGKERGE